jgi:hypothetical protein
MRDRGLQQCRHVAAIGEGDEVVHVGRHCFRRPRDIERAGRGEVTATDPVLHGTKLTCGGRLQWVVVHECCCVRRGDCGKADGCVRADRRDHCLQRGGRRGHVDGQRSSRGCRAVRGRSRRRWLGSARSSMTPPIRCGAESRATLWSAMNGGNETTIERSVRSSRVPVPDAVISGHAVATPVRVAS